MSDAAKTVKITLGELVSISKKIEVVYVPYMEISVKSTNGRQNSSARRFLDNKRQSSKGLFDRNLAKISLVSWVRPALLKANEENGLVPILSEIHMLRLEEEYLREVVKTAESIRKKPSVVRVENMDNPVKDAEVGEVITRNFDITDTFVSFAEKRLPEISTRLYELNELRDNRFEEVFVDVPEGIYEKFSLLGIVS